MLVFVDDLEEALRLTPVLKRAGYQVIFADNASDVVHWAGHVSALRRAVIGLRENLTVESLRSDLPSLTLRTIAPNIQFDVARQTILIEDQTRPLTSTEARLLHVLLDHANRPLSRAQLIDWVWGFDYHGHDREVDVYIRYLRRKIEPDPTQPRYIVTVRGLGYMLDMHNSD